VLPKFNGGKRSNKRMLHNELSRNMAQKGEMCAQREEKYKG
jgi:hypothetical protein